MSIDHQTNTSHALDDSPAPHWIEGFPEEGTSSNHFLQQHKTIDFIRRKFEKGQIGIQKTDSDIVPLETQEEILNSLPTVLAHIFLENLDLEPEQELPIDKSAPIASLGQAQILQYQAKLRGTERKAHPTELLKPENLHDTDVRRKLDKWASMSVGQRRQFGVTIWDKLVKKAFRTPPKNSTTEHPIEALRGYNGLLIGRPVFGKISSYRSLLLNASLKPYAVQYMKFEAKHDLMNESDLIFLTEHTKQGQNKAFAKELLGDENAELLERMWENVAAGHLRERDIQDFIRGTLIGTQEITATQVEIRETITPETRLDDSLQQKEGIRREVEKILTLPAYQDLDNPANDDPDNDEITNAEETEIRKLLYGDLEDENEE